MNYPKNLASPAPISRHSTHPQHERRLTLKGVLDDLIADGMVNSTDVEQALLSPRSNNSELHPLVIYIQITHDALH